MGKVKVELNRSAVRDLLRSEEMKGVCRELAEGIHSRIGERRDEYEVTTQTGRNRVNAQVAAATIAAKRSNLKHNTLLKAMR